MVAGRIACGTDIAQQLALGDRLAYADHGGAVHVSIQGRIGIAVGIGTMVDLHIVAPAVMVGGGGDDAISDGVDLGAAGGCIVSAAVTAAGVLSGYVVNGGQRAAEVQ